MYKQHIERLLEVLNAVAQLNECCDRDKAILATRGSEGLLNFLMCRSLQGGLLERGIGEDVRRIDIVAYGANGSPRIAIEAKFVPLKNLMAMQRYLAKNQNMIGDFGGKIKKIVGDRDKLREISNDYHEILTSFLLIWFCSPYGHVPLDLFLHAKENNKPVSLCDDGGRLIDVNGDCLTNWNTEASKQILDQLDLEFFCYFDIYNIYPINDHLFPEGHEFRQNNNIGVHCACSVFPLIKVENMNAFRTKWQRQKGTKPYPIYPLVRR